jgi:DNA-binding FrmR family transcriptional regulator
MQVAKTNILHRLKIARGHLDKVIDMVSKDAYCIDVVHQSIAVQAALRKVDELILENHLKTCVVDKIRNGDAEIAIKEVMEVLNRSFAINKK